MRGYDTRKGKKRARADGFQAPGASAALSAGDGHEADRGAQIVINDVFASWLADEHSGKERRLYCYGDRSDPIPTMFMIREQFWHMVGNILAQTVAVAN